ncbi:hypothetical protein [Paraferrimonas sp. SM1919]|uniref:hypothetical protein n=1 Tax=Paraferrimonas sp. SM1919 TaxID=2662263 RepID=UPI0013D866B6|nr:hypothetical protein [Paraferrimonas sp. SM1919]
MKIVKRLLKEGENKASIFEKASAYGLNPKKVSKYLAMYPDSEESKKYNRANNILIGIYSVLFLLGLLGAVPILSELPVGAMLGVLAFALLIPSAVIYCIYKKQSIGYLILCFFLFKGIFDSFKGYEADPVGVWVGAAINVCLIVYVVILKNKLFPHQNFFNTKKNDEGVSIFTKDLTSQASGPA